MAISNSDNELENGDNVLDIFIQREEGAIDSFRITIQQTDVNTVYIGGLTRGNLESIRNGLTQMLIEEGN